MAVETPSDRDYACFACGEGKYKDLVGRCPESGAVVDCGRKLLDQMVQGYELQSYIDRGHYGATLKVVPESLYNPRGKDFYDEFGIYFKLGVHPNIAELHDAGEVTLSLFGRESGWNGSTEIRCMTSSKKAIELMRLLSTAR